MKNITDGFMRSIMEQAGTQLPEHIAAKASLCVLDYLGCAYAGYDMNRRRVGELLKAADAEGMCKLLGSDRGTNAQTSALVNGMNAHAAELDDGHRYSAVHPGSVVISALLTSCANKDINGVNFLRGVVAGYEAAIRLGEAIQPSHKLRGGHATGTCGTIGAAVAVAVALNFDHEHMKGAVAAACTSASGLLETIDGPSQLKPYNAGLAAMNGYVSAMIGRSGYTGPEDPIGGERGFLRFMADEYNESALTAAGDGYRIEQIYVKPYAACRHSHPAVEGALDLTAEYTLAPADITAIEIRTYKLAIPGHDRTDIQSVEAAKMSTPFSVATAIVNRNAGIGAFTESMVKDRSILELTGKVHVTEDEEMTAASPGIRAAEVTVSLRDRRQLRKRVDYPLGEPENPMSEDMILEKFKTLAAGAGMEDGRIDSIINATLFLDKDLNSWLKTI